IYGEDHAYSLPFTGSGYESTVTQITRSDLVDFHSTWFRPNNATLVVAGDITLEEIVPHIEERFAGWQQADVPTKNVAEAPEIDQPTVYLLDRPGSQQSVIFAGNIAPPKSDPNEVAISAMNTVLGGSFTSRINMNLREDKGWSYGARSLVVDAQGPRMFIAYAPVQSDKTMESVAEMRKEVQQILDDQPVTAGELARAQNNLTLTLPGRWETLSSVASSVSEIVQYGLPHDFYETYAGTVRALVLDDMEVAAQTTVRPEDMVWIVVGDREKVEPGLRELNVGEIQYIDGDGRPVQGAQ
ncbi:MAG: M16 family metallopeptidase, partial [Bacteroidota bacterium]